MEYINKKYMDYLPKKIENEKHVSHYKRVT